MDIHMPNGAMARPAKFVKAMQIIREQKIELEMKRRVASDAEALAFKEERRARELDEALLESRRQLAVQKAKMDASPLGYHAQPAAEHLFLKRLQPAGEGAEDGRSAAGTDGSSGGSAAGGLHYRIEEASVK